MSAENWTAAAGEARDRELASHIERELPGLLAFATRLTGDPGEARGAVQDALERAWRSREQLRDPAAASGWLRSILARRVIDRHRRQRETPAGDSVALEELLLPDVADPAAMLAASESTAAMRAALRSLGSEDRIAVVLHDGEDWTASELAALLGISVEAAHKRVQRARVRLLTALAAPHTITAPSGACATVRAHAHDYLDGGLEEPARSSVRDHLDSCPRCPAALQAAAAMVGSLGADHEVASVPAALRERLRLLVAEAENTD